MTLVEPLGCTVALDEGVLRNGTGRYAKMLRDLAGLYLDAPAFERLAAEAGDQIAYKVSEFHPNEKPGDMIFGVTHMVPGKIGEEFFMTRGHIHAKAGRSEIYYGQKGHGLMLMESPEGDIRIVEVGPQTICYVPPYWIHRAVNTGDADFVMVFAYPADAGQDYGIIERSGGMRARILSDSAGGWKQVENANYRQRSADEIAAILQAA